MKYGLSASGLTDSTVTVVVEMIPLAGGFLMLQLLTSPLGPEADRVS